MLICLYIPNGGSFEAEYLDVVECPGLSAVDVIVIFVKNVVFTFGDGVLGVIMILWHKSPMFHLTNN